MASGVAYGSEQNHWRPYFDWSSAQSATQVAVNFTAGMQACGWGFDIYNPAVYVDIYVWDYSQNRDVYHRAGGPYEFHAANGSWDATPYLGCERDVTFARGHSGYSVSMRANVRNQSGYMDGDLWATYDVAVPAKDSYKVSYSANGGTGAPAAQTKWHGEALRLSSSKPSRPGHSFQGWATSASGKVAYAAGASYSADAAATLYAVWKADTYKVSYSANGGTGAPASQTKTYGADLALSGTRPARTGYAFSGWATSASGAVAYQPGGTYKSNSSVTLYARWTPVACKVTFDGNGGKVSKNATQTFTYDAGVQAFADTGVARTNYELLGWSESPSATEAAYSASSGVANSWIASHAPSVTLYAVWKLRYTSPTLWLVLPARCSSDGTEEDEGTWGKVTAHWSTCTIIPGITIKSLSVRWRRRTPRGSWSEKSADVSGTSGTTTVIFGDGALETDAAYDVEVTVMDTSSYAGNSLARAAVLAGSFYTLDFASGGHGIGLGAPATVGQVTSGLPLVVSGGVTSDWHMSTPCGYGHEVRDSNKLPYHLLASTGWVDSTYTDRHLTLYLARQYAGGGAGILTCALRTNAPGAASTAQVRWVARDSQLPAACVAWALQSTSGHARLDVFYVPTSTWQSVVAYPMGMGAREASRFDGWSLYGSWEKSSDDHANCEGGIDGWAAALSATYDVTGTATDGMA